MADKFQIAGTWTTTPQTGSLIGSGSPSLTTPINETVILSKKNFDDYELDADAPVAVAFGGVASANVVMIESDRKIRVRLTSADGALAEVAVDGHLEIISRSVPYTAIDLTRIAATTTLVKVFLGQKA